MSEKAQYEEYEKLKNYIQNYLVGEEKQIDIIYAGIKAAQETHTVPAFLLRGPPGAGKTFITKLIANYFNAEYVFIQNTLNTAEDELLYKYIPSETSKSGIKILYGPLPEALIKSQQKITVLVLDEFDKTRPSADALLLDYIQNARISFRIDEKEETINGEKSNLLIFLTSNDNREFSEPLLRRLIVVEFQPPNPNGVEKILEKEFSDKKIVKLLSKLYVASLRAGLTKPVTIQELRQLGHALQVMPNASFNDLLYSFVVKSYEDMEKLNEALNTETEQTPQESLPDVAQALVQHQEQELQEEQEEKEHSVEEVLAKIKVPKDEVINAEKIDAEKEERTFNTTISKDFNEYSNIIKTFEPTPNERPDVLGKFQIVLDETELKLTASSPLSLEEVYKLAETSMRFEAYIEDFIYIPAIHDIINIAKESKLNFTYYTKSIIIAKNENVILRLEKLNEKYFRIKMYIKYTGWEKQFLNQLLTYQENVVLKKFLESLKWKENEIIHGKYFNSQEYEELSEFLETSRIDAKLIIEPHQQLYIQVTRSSEAEVRYNIDYETNRNAIKFIVKRLDITTEKTINSDNIKNIINEYAGTYELLDGLLALKRMAEEIQSVSRNDN